MRRNGARLRCLLRVDDLPIFPLSMVLLPDELVPLHIFEPRYREMVARCESFDEPFAIVFESGGQLAPIACTAYVAEVFDRFPDGRSNILVRGHQRVAISEVFDRHSYRSARAHELPDELSLASIDEQDAALALFRDVVRVGGQEEGDTSALAGAGLSYRLAARIELSDDARQALLEDRDETSRLVKVAALLAAVRVGIQVAAEVERRARANGHVRSTDELARELGL